MLYKLKPKMDFNLVILILQITKTVSYVIIDEGQKFQDRMCECDTRQKTTDLEAKFTELQEIMFRHINTSDVLTTACPDGWLANQGSCYLFDRAKVVFDQAKTFCARNNAHLAHIETDGENKVLLNMLRTFRDENVKFDFWIGLTDEETEEVWRWYDDGSKATFLNWFGTEPQEIGGQDCAVVFCEVGNNCGWADAPCTNSYRTLCEKKYRSA